MKQQELVARLREHLPLLGEGKVRDSYEIPAEYSRRTRRRLIHVSSRRSIFDFPLGFEIPGQGEALLIEDLFYRMRLRERLPNFYEDDLVAYGTGIDAYLPPELRGIPELQRSALVVNELQMTHFEWVLRNLLTGSGYRTYIKGQALCGHVLPLGLRDGSVIPGGPISTPTTKAMEGHDEACDHKEVERVEPGVQGLALTVFKAMTKLADNAGYILADAKMEGGRYILYSQLRFAWGDERGTTDASRYIPKKAYQEQFVEKGGPLPSTRDKEILRKAGKAFGINELDPLREEDRNYVLGVRFPHEVIEEMQGANEEIVQALTGHSIAQFQKEVMGVRG